jgi:hypothetical protein
MRRLPTAYCLLPTAFFCLGCLSGDKPTALVSANAFGAKPPAPSPAYKAAYAAAPIKMATRVDGLGRKLLAANPQVGIRPLFTTGGDPKPEIFHKGTAEIIITTGLVNQCKTEGELAAVLCAELGKMISEREAVAGPAPKPPLRPPPMELRIGNDQGGIVGRQDELYAIERAKFDKQSRQQDPPQLPPDPQTLARGYLTKGGYPATDLDAVAPLLKEADKNSGWEKAMKSNPSQQWKP